MAVESLTFDNDPISVLGTGLLAGEYSGTLTVDYSTGKVTGSIVTSPVLGSSLKIFTFNNFTETFDSSTGLYTLSDPGLVGFSITYSGMAPTKANSVLSVLGLPVFSGTGGDVISTPVPCFLRGTLISTPSGERPIEDLRTGEVVTTADGASREIIWIGTRSYDQAFVSKKFWPVRIAAGAIADQLPKRDLFLSPCHAVLIDGVLIPSGELVNGSTITQDKPSAQIDYYHIELEEHDIVVAEGVPTETFIDDNSRMMFQNASEYYELHPHREDKDAVYSAVRVDDGEELETIRERIAERAAAVSKIAA